MKNTFVILPLLIIIGLVAISPALAQDTNLLDQCVTDFDPDQDYFPDKVELTHAEKFSVEYFSNYKVITVTDAFDSATPFIYVLVQCGTPAPDASDFADNTQFIDVPAGDMIAMSTTQLPHLTDLNLLDNLVGLDSFFFVNAPTVLEMIDAGKLTEFGSGSDINIELVLEAEPDVVMTYGFNPDTDAHPVLLEAGIFTAINAEWREVTPLGRAEWLKYTALFYNAEAEANLAFSEIETAYNEARDLALSVSKENRPVVLWNSFSPYTEAWHIPSADTYVGTLIEDAGGVIALGDEVTPDTALSFEVVYDATLDANVWITNVFGVTTLDDLLEYDVRYEDFAAVQNDNTWNNSLDVNENGGNNYFELGVTNPHLILQDLVAVFHPELMPDHEFRFYQLLQPADE